MFKIKKIESSNKTLRMPNDSTEELEALANENDISFNRTVIQCRQYALENLDNKNSKKQTDI